MDDNEKTLLVWVALGLALASVVSIALDVAIILYL